MIRGQYTRWIKEITTLCILVVSIHSCKEPDPFPNTPNITFENISYSETDNGTDTLTLEFNFEDGDGDLGLSSEDNTYPYNDFYYIVDSATISSNNIMTSFRFVKYGDQIALPPFYQLALSQSGGLYQFYSDTDDRPSFSCENYEIEDLDTLYILKNEFRNNIYVKFFRNRGNGFEEYNYKDANAFECGLSFDGRFPILDRDNIGTSLQGVLKYKIQSTSFRVVFRNYPMKLQFYILDRALNTSNVAETPVFTLDELLSEKD
ncbi:hypothetical protein N6H18_10925 [Reichenbachiella agarivorans]|uniref:Uncharacterized protein n=1 Tax=Reichenbachiella agarivorans TaxID=2979464 RepID=A0ABY6CLA2_9BACT|nr:hypothetical protein [Reichenbachiella agarivorans]UXP30865.1 hypothetical protein N6H18_10925 [Reichenbachiella agarivorans]